MKAYSAGCGNANAIIRYKGASDVDPEGDRHTPRTGVVSKPLVQFNCNFISHYANH